MAAKIALVSVLCLLLNVPLGMWREHTKKFSWQWLLAIHASIPVIIWLRISLHLHPAAIPINITAAVIGQLIGSRWERARKSRSAPLAGPAKSFRP